MNLSEIINKDALKEKIEMCEEQLKNLRRLYNEDEPFEEAPAPKKIKFHEVSHFEQSELQEAEMKSKIVTDVNVSVGMYTKYLALWDFLGNIFLLDN